MTGQQLADRVLQSLGVAGIGGIASGPQAEMIRVRANELIDAWKLDRLLIHTLLRTVTTLTASTQRYTIGSGGDINIVRPVSIQMARIIPDNSVPAAQRVELKCDIFSDDEWAALAMKSHTSTFPAGLYYDKSFAATERGNIDVWPIPTTSICQLVLYTPLALTAFEDLDTDYPLAPGYERLLRTNVAIEIAEDLGRRLADLQKLVDSARASKEDLGTTNIYVPTLQSPRGSPNVSGGFDIRSGGSQ